MKQYSQISIRKCSKAIICLFIVLLPVLLLSGCGNRNKRYLIGVSQCSDDEWRRQMNDEINREILFHEDADVEIRSAGDDNMKQIEDIKYFLDKKVDVLIVAPNEAEALTPVIREAYKKGVPVIIFDRNINDTTYTTYIDLDNVAIGEAAGRFALDAHKKKGGKILELRGLMGSTPAEERHAGFMKIMSVADTGSLPLSFNADWNDAPAYRITDSMLRNEQDIKVIYAHNDVMAIAAARAAADNRRNDITVIGTDGAPGLGVKAVADSLIDATFTYPTVGEEAVTLAMKILEGKKVGKVTHGPATTMVDPGNAGVFLNLNRVLKQKTNLISDMNQKYFILSDSQKTHRIMLYASLTALLLLLAVVFGLLYFMRQKNLLQKQLSDKNALLTEQKEKQDILYERLEEATRSKLAFYTNVSHDLRTPLALIADPVEKIAKEKYLPPNDRSLMNLVVRNVKILRRMIDQILDFRRYENGLVKLNLQEVDIFEIVRLWVSDFENYAHRCKISFIYSVRNLSGCDHPMMAIDVEKLERVVFNLISNAFKFTPEGGKIEVEAYMDTSSLRLTVSDTGIGLKEEDLNKIFDRFYQVDTLRPKGSGIGLSLSKAFVELMDGKIEVKSVYGDGASFCIEIPVIHTDTTPSDSQGTGHFDFSLIDTNEQNPEMITDRQNLPEEETAKPLLLVIDDNDDIRTLVRLMVSDRYSVIDAADGKEGLRMAMKYIPDVIVCDIMMPDMDGLEVTRRLKEEKITSHIPVLILTACRLDEQRVKSYDSGADGFLSKPFTEPLLQARCAALIANRQRIYDLFLENTPENTHLFQRNKDSDGEKIPSADHADTTPKSRRMELDNEFYRDFMNIVRKLYKNEDLTVGDIAYQLGIGATQLTRKIKAITNSTPVEIIRGVRLRIARKKLLTTADTVAEIAFSTGFSTPQYFARCFKETFGLTPTELRQSVK